jgi:uncharacterized membrane protein YphA (DoxX/SURF4 family)
MIPNTMIQALTSALLHVRYVVDTDDGPRVTPTELIREVVLSPDSALVAGVLVVFFIAYLSIMPRLRGWGAFRATLAASLRDYERYIPWILRLSAGIALMGSGLADYLFAPHLEISPRSIASFILVASGFALLVGVAVRLAALVGLLVFAYALGVQGPDVLMASEVAVALIALTAIGPGRPSLDDLFSRALPAAPRTIRSAGRLRTILGPEAGADHAVAMSTWLPVLLRVGLGIAVLYAGLVEKILDPGPALATVERYNLAFWVVDGYLWVFLAGLTEIILGIALITGTSVRPVSALTFLVLTITLFAIPDDPVVAHVALWGTASAVFILGAGPRSVDRYRLRRTEMAEI